MNAFKVGSLMFVVIFLWIFTLPLLFITSVIWLPLGAFLLVFTTTLSFWIQHMHANDIVLDGTLRSMMRVVDLGSWFDIKYEGSLIPHNSLILAHPHGILCCGMVCYHFKQSNTVFAVAPILFYIPVFGWAARNLGLIPATSVMIREAIKKGASVILYVGGIEELIATEKKELYIKKRWGYLKLIRDLKCNVVCVWTAGEFDTFTLPNIPALRFRQRLAKILGVGIMFPWVFGWNSIWLPRRVPLTVFTSHLTLPSSFELKDLRLWYHRNLYLTIRSTEPREAERLRAFLSLPSK